MNILKAIAFLSLFVPAIGWTQQSGKFECSAASGTAVGKLSIDIPAKTVVLIDNAGNSTVIFDNNTLCGWRPSAGTANVDCPFSGWIAADSFAADLACNRSTSSGSRPLTSGSLQFQAGIGHLICYVYSNVNYNLSLSNCVAK